MRTLLKGGRVWLDGMFQSMDIEITDGKVTARGACISSENADRVFSLNGMTVFPGFADVHVHLREPGFSYKETIASGTAACARGGYTTVCAMPNLSPAPDTPEHLEEQLALIRRDACIHVLPYGTITYGQKGEGDVVDMSSMAGSVCGFSDDGRGVKEAETMRLAMERCRDAGSIIAAHCEDMSLIPKGGAIHDGSFARENGIPGIPSESEWGPIVRDIELCRETGCRYHVCHVSCRESVEAIRKAKAEGVDITCETGPHYLLLNQDDLKDEGRFKMNPPLRNPEDQAALLEGLLDGTIDCIATDHAPHSEEEKSRGLRASAMGIVGIETAFPLLYTYLVETGKVPMNAILDGLTTNPRKRFGLPGGLNVGDEAQITVFNLNVNDTIDPESFLSKGHATPFTGWEVHARCVLTICGDKISYQDKEACL